MLAKLLAVGLVGRTMPVGNQHVDGLADQFAAGIAEQVFRLGIDLNDNAALIDGHDRVRDRFEKTRGQEGLCRTCRFRP